MRIRTHFTILSTCLAVASGASAQDFKVTLLGTGVPFPVLDRFGAATLVEAGKERLLFDVGRGATIRLNQISVPIGSINAVFLTHFHSDHTSGVPDLWLTGWIQRYYGNRQNPFRIIGPTGTISFMQNLPSATYRSIPSVTFSRWKRTRSLRTARPKGYRLLCLDQPNAASRAAHSISSIGSRLSFCCNHRDQFCQRAVGLSIQISSWGESLPNGSTRGTR